MGVGKGAAYGISETARADPQLEFPFKGAGLESVDVIGDFRLVQGAALGNKIDIADFELGTPRFAKIIASTKLAGGHSNDYLLFNEEAMFPMVDTTGTKREKIRSDLVFFEMGSGGEGFSVGSINWVGALAWKGFENNGAMITANALHEFVMRGEKRRDGEE